MYTICNQCTSNMQPIYADSIDAAVPPTPNSCPPQHVFVAGGVRWECSAVTMGGPFASSSRLGSGA